MTIKHLIAVQAPSLSFEGLTVGDLEQWITAMRNRGATEETLILDRDGDQVAMLQAFVPVTRGKGSDDGHA